MHEWCHPERWTRSRNQNGKNQESARTWWSHKRQHSSSSISTTLPLLSQDMSPTPSMQTTSLSGVQLSTLHQWIPSHTGIHGNEVADQLAKEGSKKQQPKSKPSYQEAKTLIRNKRLADFKHRNGGYNPHQDTLRLISRHEQTMIFRLRTGHCRLRSHMKKSGIEKSALCPCGLEAHPTAHVLQSCPLHKRERERTWPTESSLGKKLHGTATDLLLTVRFIALTGLQI